MARPARGKVETISPQQLRGDPIVRATLSKENQLDRETVKRLCAGVIEENKQKFLVALALLANRSRAARCAGVHVATTYVWRRTDDIFAKQYELAMHVAAELHEDELMRRASEGILEPVFQQGKMIGAIRKYDTAALIFLLKGAMPDKYADRTKVEGTVDVVERLHAGRERARTRGSRGKNGD